MKPGLSAQHFVHVILVYEMRLTAPSNPTPRLQDLAEVTGRKELTFNKLHQIWLQMVPLFVQIEEIKSAVWDKNSQKLPVGQSQEP